MKIRLLEQNLPVTFVPGSVRCSSDMSSDSMKQSILKYNQYCLTLFFKLAMPNICPATTLPAQTQTVTQQWKHTTSLMICPHTKPHSRCLPACLLCLPACLFGYLMSDVFILISKMLCAQKKTFAFLMYLQNLSN